MLHRTRGRLCYTSGRRYVPCIMFAVLILYSSLRIETIEFRSKMAVIDLPIELVDIVGAEAFLSL